MKKIITFLLLTLFLSPAFAETVENPVLEAGVSFDWVSKTQLQRDENIAKIHNILFSGDKEADIKASEFKAKYSDYLKDKNHMNNYFDIANGKNEDDKAKYSGFFLKNGLLVVYGIQYKDNLKNIFYYDAMGTLKYVDIFSSEYPNFPYSTSQYKVNGDLVAKFYYLSDYDQYIFNPNGAFKGRWFKDKMYNKNAKVILTRSNW